MDSYTHDVTALLKLAGLTTILNDQVRVNAAVGINWAIIKDWSEVARYKRGTSEVAARDLYNAITDPLNGIMQWITAHW